MDELRKCPVCGTERRRHSSGDDENYEEWEFACGLIVHRYDSGWLHAEHYCKLATRIAMERLNDRRADNG